MSSVETRASAWAARELPAAMRRLEAAQAEIDGTDWWDGPPWHLESARDDAADFVARIVRAICGVTAEGDD